MVEPQRGRQDIAHGAVDHLVRGLAGFGRVLHQPGRERFPELAVPGAIVRQPLAPLDQDLGDVPRKLAHEVGRHPKSPGHEGWAGFFGGDGSVAGVRGFLSHAVDSLGWRKTEAEDRTTTASA